MVEVPAYDDAEITGIEAAHVAYELLLGRSAIATLVERKSAKNRS